MLNIKLYMCPFLCWKGSTFSSLLDPMTFSTKVKERRLQERSLGDFPGPGSLIPDGTPDYTFFTFPAGLFARSTG